MIAAAVPFLAAAVGLPSAHPPSSPGEAAASALFDQVLSSPPALRIFLKKMPKGGDLHNHLSGTPYAEDYLQWAADAGYCVDGDGEAIAPPPCADGKSIKAVRDTSPFAYTHLIDAMSTRGWRQGVGRDNQSGHGQFFGSFGRFGAISDASTAQAMATARRLAAGDRLNYVELIHNPAALVRHTLAAGDEPLDEAGLAARYESEIATVPAIITAAIAELDRDEADMCALLGCGSAHADPACVPTIHYLAWGWRDLPPAQAFRSLILAFAMAARDPRYVGVNIVQPEDWPTAMRDYDLHMAMFRFLEARYPTVHRSIHAGELAFGQVPPQALRNHIRKAVASGAQRIGHGTAIAFEEDAADTLASMAHDHIPVEVNLTSNAVILGVEGHDHPLALYRRAGVPVLLSTDDQGILRTDMTNEYMVAAREQGLNYTELKQMARASLEYAFIAGRSLWDARQPGQFAVPCRDGLDKPACRTFIKSSEKARLQAELEESFDRFETKDVPSQAHLMALRTEAAAKNARK